MAFRNKDRETGYLGSPNGTGMHLRNANRYRVAAPVSFWWSGPDKSVHTGQGITQDISSSGALIATSDCLPDKVKIHLEVQLPRLKGNDHGMVLHGEGLVVRVEGIQPNNPLRRVAYFAASAQFYPEKEDTTKEPPDCATELSGAAYLN
jgi:hypothetical protein